CSLGPDKLRDTAKRLLACASVPVLMKPNAGLPRSENGKTVYDITPHDFSQTMRELIGDGIRIAGGCCGTTPEYIKALVDKTHDIVPKAIELKNISVVTSYCKTVEFGKKPVLIGERINPTGKKRFKQALVENDISYILNEGISQQEKGVHILDVNVGIPEIDEKNMLVSAVCELQSVTDLPLQIDTSDADAMERALRRYNGKAMINSVNGKEESMAAIFPLVKKYGGLVVALTLDENGIPADVNGRMEIARKILVRAAQYGISRKDIIFDTLAMTVSADKDSPSVTLGALKRVKEELGCNTTLGVSNVSFGLPQRDAVNSTFYAIALQNGLDAAIMNPYSADMMKTYHAFCTLSGMDDNCADYIEFVSKLPQPQTAVSAVPTTLKDAETDYGSELMRAVARGMKNDAASLTDELLKSIEPLDIVRDEIIPALDKVGKGYEEKRVYLPQLLMSAEAAKSAFERIKIKMLSADSAENTSKCDFVMATVKGDIHDIGKNIVCLLLENYGFRVHDLGKDVPPEEVVGMVCELHAPLAGLSALMTTTVPAMEETVKLLHEKAPWCKVVVGGAVLTEEYAKSIGADKYAADAMEAVRYAEKVFSEN
ncbi:MAG: dihydropteroate synthase, partial [Clostridia bacterium]|nr:dihydropteroate synthase [Clostridia bacterium]